MDQEQSIFRILSIDPGSETIGYSVMDIDNHSKKILHITAWTITGSKLVTLSELAAINHGARFARIRAHSQMLIKILAQYEPSYVAIETPYYNPRRPGAFEVLVEVLAMIRNTIFDWNPWITIELTDPATIKKKIGVSGKSGDKQAVRNALSDILTVGSFITPELDEHAVDAIAVGFCFYQNHILG